MDSNPKEVGRLRNEPISFEDRVALLIPDTREISCFLCECDAPFCRPRGARVHGMRNKDVYSPLLVSALRRSQGPVKRLLYDMFVRRTDSVIFRAYLPGPSIFRVFGTSRPERQEISPIQECAARYGAANCSRFRDVSTKISCLVCMSSSSGMRRVGVALLL
jgi:hypothetical protein